MSDQNKVWALGDLDPIHVSRGADQGTLYLDIFRFHDDQQHAHRYSMTEDMAKELLRQIAVHLVPDGTLVLPQDGPTKLQ